MSHKKMLDRFVEEYRYDHDVIAAAMRCGYDRENAKQYGYEFMDDPYVIKQLKGVLDADPDAEGEAEFDKRLVMRTLRKVMLEGCRHGDQVKAASIMAQIRRMMKDVHDETVTNNIMLIPSTMSREDWDAAIK